MCATLNDSLVKLLTPPIQMNDMRIEPAHCYRCASANPMRVESQVGVTFIKCSNCDSVQNMIFNDDF
jgi:hypothetical protein